MVNVFQAFKTCFNVFIQLFYTDIKIESFLRNAQRNNTNACFLFLKYHYTDEI